MTKILARKKDGKKCQIAAGLKNVEPALNKHLNIGFLHKGKQENKVKK